MDPVFYLASSEIQHNVKDQAKHEERFYNDHAWQRARRFLSLFRTAYFVLISVGEATQFSKEA